MTPRRAAAPGRAAAGVSGGPRGRPDRGRRRRRPGDDRGGDRRGRARRADLPRRGDGRPPADPGRRRPGGAAGARFRLRPRRRREARGAADGEAPAAPRPRALLAARRWRVPRTRRRPLRDRLEELHRAGDPRRDRRAGARARGRRASSAGSISAARFVCHRALVAGELDLYPEYTGTAFTAILKQKPVARSRQRPRAGRRRVRAPVGPRVGAAARLREHVRARDARGRRRGELQVAKISDLARHAELRPGFGYEFVERADGFPGLAAAYGLRVRRRGPAEMDLGLLYPALAQGKVDVVAGNSTDGLIAAMQLAVLEDDRRYFPPYEAAFVVRDAAWKDARVRGALEPLAGRDHRRRDAPDERGGRPRRARGPRTSRGSFCRAASAITVTRIGGRFCYPDRNRTGASCPALSSF